MVFSSLSDQEWRELYDSAIEFKEINCWDWMDDSHLFGVQNPVDGEIAYCCVLGALGEVYGLNGYLGLEGLDSYFRLSSSGERIVDQVEAFLYQKSITVTFENRNRLEREDREVIKRLGLNFRGENKWPLFRSYRPGYFPWFLTDEEAKFLKIILRQAKEVALNFRETGHLLNPPSRDCCLVRIPEEKDGNIIWRDKWQKIPPPPKLQLKTIPLDETRLIKIKKTYLKKKGIWEVDFFYTYPPIKEGEEKPYLPIIFLYVDNKSGLIIKGDLSSHSDYQSKFQKSFLDLIEDKKLLPQELRVKREEVFRLLEPITSCLEIPLVKVRSLIALEKAQMALYKTFGFRK